MSDYNGPGEGWREVKHPEAGGEYVVYTDGNSDRYWVREEPVPPLPTEPWNVFRVTYRDGSAATFMRHSNGQLMGVHSGVFHPQDPMSVKSWQSLSEPCEAHYGCRDLDKAEQDGARRAAIAVLRDVVREQGDRSVFHKIARDHGITL